MFVLKQAPPAVWEDNPTHQQFGIQNTEKLVLFTRVCPYSLSAQAHFSGVGPKWSIKELRTVLGPQLHSKYSFLFPSSAANMQALKSA